jgi:hypothetical protein
LKANNETGMFKLIKWSIKALLLVTGALSLIKCSSGYRKKGGKVLFNGREIIDKNFIVLSKEFGKDSTTAWYKDKPFHKVDIATFEAIDDHYAKDKSSVYFCDEYRDGQSYYLTKRQTITTVLKAIPASFVTLGHGYAKDSHSAFFESTAFIVKDIATLKSINKNFVKDDFQAYYDLHPITGSDGKTFELLNGEFAKDTANIYFFGYTEGKSKNIYKLSCDKETFEVLVYPYSRDQASVFYEGSKIIDAHAPTFNVLGNGYSKDKDHIFFRSGKMTDANVASFVQYEENESGTGEFCYAKDDKAVFMGGKKINGADIASFKVLTLGYGSDNNQVFYKTSPVKKADPASFKVYAHGYGDTDAEDAKNKYLAGVKVILPPYGKR